MVSAAPMFVQTPAPAGERWNWALATPEPPSAELEETATELPRTFALEAGAVIAPVGLVESLVKVRTVAVLVLPALSVEVTDSVGLFASPALPGEVVGGDVRAAGGGVDGLGRMRPGADGAAEHGEDRGGRAGAGVGDRVLQLEVAGCRATVVDRGAVQERSARG